MREKNNAGMVEIIAVQKESKQERRVVKIGGLGRKTIIEHNFPYPF